MDGWISLKIPTGFSFVCIQDNTGELDTDHQDELKRARRLGEEEEEKSRKSALLFGSEDTFDSIAGVEEKVCGLWCLFMIHSCAAPGLIACHNCSCVSVVFILENGEFLGHMFQ